MSVNRSTYLKYEYTAVTAGSGDSERLSSTSDLVYGLIIGVNGDSASASTGNWVGGSGVTKTNKDGVFITSTQPFTISPASVGDELLAIDLKDYYVATAENDEIYYAVLREVAQT